MGAGFPLNHEHPNTDGHLVGTCSFRMGATMAAFTFSPPANIADFPPGSPGSACLLQLWNWNLLGDTLTSITGDPWNVLNDSNRYFYFNPATTPIPADAKTLPIQWIAFPNRPLWYFGKSGSPGNPFQLELAALLELVDTGKIAGNPAFASRIILARDPRFNANSSDK